MTILQAAEAFLMEGLNPIPLKNNKAPHGLPAGHGFLEQTIDSLEYFEKAAKIGIVCGPVSGGFYCLDFDKHQGQDIEPAVEEFVSHPMVKTLILEDKMTCYTTPSGGYHFYFKCESEYSGTPVARWDTGDVMIELRGRGQYIAIAPSEGYTYIEGCEIIKLNYTEKTIIDQVLMLCQSLSQKHIEKPIHEKKSATGRSWPSAWPDDTPIHQFNNNGADTVRQLLAQAGWTRMDRTHRTGVEYWQRPGKNPHTDGWSATFGAKFNMFYCFSLSASPFQGNKAYNPFEVLTLLQFHGDWKKAREHVKKLYPEKINLVQDKPEKHRNKARFPIEVFPEFLQDYIEKLNKSLNFNPDFLAVAAMFAVATINGNKYKLRVKHGWDAPTIFWFACVGFPGTIKTHPVKTMLRPLNIIDINNKKQFDEEMKHWNPDQKGSSRQPKPKFRQLLINDYTLEALHHVHDFNRRGIGLYRDELKGFLNDMNKYRKGSDEEFWLESFNNGSYIVNRATKDPIMIHNICINMIGTIQHEVLDTVINEYAGNGLIDRFLYTNSETNIFPIPQEEIHPDYQHAWLKLIQQLDSNIKYTDADDTCIIPLPPEAFEYYQAIDKQYVQTQSDDFENQDIKNYLSKMKTYVPRFALLLAIMEYGFEYPTITVELRHMVGAQKIAGYFIETARTLFDTNKTTIDIRNVETSLRGMKRSEKIRELAKKGFTQSEISRYYGVSRQMINKTCKENE